MVRYSKLERAGLADQIRLDKEARKTEWEKATPNVYVLERLQAHIEENEAKLRE